MTSSIVDCVRQRFFEYLNRCMLREHIKNLFQGHPEASQRLEDILERFEFMLRHSVLCKVRHKFYSMPGGKDLKRLEQNVHLAELKGLLVKVFTEFYPDWVFHNVYGEIRDGLWLSFFLDTEELEIELKTFFDSYQGHITGREVLEKIKFPDDLGVGSTELFEAAGVCREMEDLIQEKDSFRSRNVHSRLVYQV